VALVGALLATAGCGSSDPGAPQATAGSSAATAPADATKAQYLQQANGLCRRERRGIRGRIAAFLHRHHGDGRPAAEQYDELLDFVLLPTVEAETKALYYLPLPAFKGSERFEEVVFAEKSVVDELALMSRIPSIEFAERRFASSARGLKEFGLPACTNGPGERREWAAAR
jgi:hypothetical protein